MLVINEAGMVGSLQLARFIGEADRAARPEGTRLVLGTVEDVQDWQLMVRMDTEKGKTNGEGQGCAMTIHKS